MAVFDADSTERPDNYIAALVGEDKKYKSEEELARGKYEADLFIENLKKENKELRELADSRKAVEDLLNERQRAPVPPAPETNQPAGNAEVKPLTDEDLAERIRKITAEEESKNRTANNVNTVSARLVELYGSEDNAKKIVNQRATELEVPVQWLMDQAARSPKAFYATLGITDKSAPPAGPTHGNVNPTTVSQNFGAVKEGTYKYYQAIRKADPKLYQKLTLKMHEDAAAKGEAFYD